MCFAHILFGNQLVSFQKFPVFSGGGNWLVLSFVVIPGPRCLYFFFASPKEKVTKRKASFGQRLRRPKHSSTLLLWGNSIRPRSTCGQMWQQYYYWGCIFSRHFRLCWKMCFAHILLDNQLVSFQKFPVFSGTGNPEFVVMRGPCCLYFFFASLPIGIGRQQK